MYQIVVTLFTENELLLNLKPGKTELLLFGTNQRLAKIPRDLEVIYNFQLINVTTTYKYLGVELTSSLNLNSQFEKNYKKVSARLRMLQRIRHLLNNKAAKDIFNLMILPILSYCSLLKPSFNSTKVSKFKSIEKRAKTIIRNFNPDKANSPF